MKQKFTLVSTMKNEAPFILEWVAHYRTLGFDEIIICTNDCADPTVRMVKRLEALGLAKHHPTKIRSGGIHRSALRQAMRYEEADSADWIFVCDVDEFLNIHVDDGSVRALVAQAGEDADIISVPWRIFGPNGVSAYEDRRVTEQFTMAEPAYDAITNPETGKFVKSLYRNSDKYARSGLHFPILRDEEAETARWVWPDGRPHQETPPDFATAQVNHYALRSLDSYLVKRDRGRANHMNHDLGLDYWQRFDRNEIEDLSIRRYDEGSNILMEELRADFRMVRLQGRAVRWHEAKAAEMRERSELSDMIAEMESTLHPETPRASGTTG